MGGADGLYGVTRDGTFAFLARVDKGIYNSAPAVCATNDVVVFGAMDGVVYGVDARSGAQRWRHQTPKQTTGGRKGQAYVYSSAVIDDRGVAFNCPPSNFGESEAQAEELARLREEVGKFWQPSESRDVLLLQCDATLHAQHLLLTREIMRDMFRTPQVIKLMKQSSFVLSVVDYCQYGTCWKKPTGLLHCGIPGLQEIHLDGSS